MRVREAGKREAIVGHRALLRERSMVTVPQQRIVNCIGLECRAKYAQSPASWSIAIKPTSRKGFVFSENYPTICRLSDIVTLERT